MTEDEFKKKLKELETEQLTKLRELVKEWDIENRTDAPPVEFQREYARITQLYNEKIRLMREGK